MQAIKNKKVQIASLCLFLAFATLVTLTKFNRNSSFEESPSIKIDDPIKRSDIVWTDDLTGEEGIYIDDSNPSFDWNTNVASYDWISGAGTEGNPYEIRNVLFDGENRQNLNLITIKNSVAHFRIEDCILFNTYNNYWDQTTGNAINLESVENGIITNVNTSDCTNGIRLVNSESNRIQGIFANLNHRSGILISGGSNNRIRNNTISNNHGITLVGGTYNNDVLENIITDGGYEDVGISLSNSHYNNITFNTIYDYQEGSGIALGGSNYNNVSGNSVRNNGIGLDISTSNNNFISANIFFNNTPLCFEEYSPYYPYELIDYPPCYDPEEAYYGFGLWIRSSSGNTIVNNNISKNRFHGIYIENSDNHSIWENTVMNNGADDIHLFNTLAIDLALNDMYGSGLYFDIPYSGLADINIETSNLVNGKPIYLYINQSGLDQTDFINAGQIFLYDCNDIFISNLEFDFVTTGITLVNCINSTISSNEAAYNSKWAISLYGCNYNRIFNNDAINSSIILKNSNHSNVVENTVSNSKIDGISLEQCYYNIISGNTASYNQKIGIKLFITNHSLLFNNVANNNEDAGISIIGAEDDWIWNGDDWIYVTYRLLNITLTSNEANENGDLGIIIENVNNFIIRGNTVKKNSDGITLRNFNSGEIADNEVTGNKYGLIISSGSDIIVSNNTAISNVEYWSSTSSIKGGAGISISGCHDVEVNDNVVNGNAQGLIISDSSASEVNNNRLSDNGKEPTFFLFLTTPPGDTGIKITGSSNINITGNILNGNGIGLSGGSYHRCFLNQINDFGFAISHSDNNTISGNLIIGALIAIDLESSSFNNITFNIIVAQQCFREKGECISNLFENNDCTEVLPNIYLREIFSLVGLASVLGLNIPLFLKKRKERK